MRIFAKKACELALVVLLTLTFHLHSTKWQATVFVAGIQVPPLSHRDAVHEFRRKRIKRGRLIPKIVTIHSPVGSTPAGQAVAGGGGGVTPNGKGGAACANSGTVIGGCSGSISCGNGGCVIGIGSVPISGTPKPPPAACSASSSVNSRGFGGGASPVGASSGGASAGAFCP